MATKDPSCGTGSPTNRRLPIGRGEPDRIGVPFRSLAFHNGQRFESLTGPARRIAAGGTWSSARRITVRPCRLKRIGRRPCPANESVRRRHLFHPGHPGQEPGADRTRTFGSVTAMKRSNRRSHQHINGFQPLHFTWQPWPPGAIPGPRRRFVARAVQCIAGVCEGCNAMNPARSRPEFLPPVRQAAADVPVLDRPLLVGRQLARPRQRLLRGVLLHQRQHAGQVAAGDAAQRRPVVVRQAGDAAAGRG